MLSSVTDRASDIDTEKLEALRPENIAKNRFSEIVPRAYLLCSVQC